MLLFVLKGILNLILYIMRKFQAEKEAFKRFLSHFQQQDDLNNKEEESLLSLLTRQPSDEEKNGGKKLAQLPGWVSRKGSLNREKS